MKRPLFVVGTGFVLGLRGAFFCLGWGQLAIMGAAAALAALLGFVGRKKGWSGAGIALLLAVAIGAGWSWRYSVVKEEPFRAAEGQTVYLEGLVDTAAYYGSYTSYTLQAGFPGRADLPQGAIVLRTYGESEFVPGDVIQGTVRLAELQSRYYRSRGTRGLAYGVDLQLAAEPGFHLQRLLLRLRARLGQNLDTALDPRGAGLARAMVLGEQDAARQDDYRSMRQSGTAHLLVVSGLHLSVVAAAAGGLTKRLPRPVSASAVLLAGFAFAGLAGFTGSMARAYVMLAMQQGAGLLSRRSDGVNSLGLALVLIGIFQPGWLLGQGIWLSAGATLGILTVAPQMRRWLAARLPQKKGWGWVAGGLGISMGAYLTTLPLLLLFHGTAPLLAPVANLLTAPFSGVAVVGSMLCALGGGAAWVRPVALVTGLAGRMILGISGLFARIPAASLSLDEGWMLLWLGFVAMGVLLVLRLPAPKDIAAYGGLLAVVVLCAGMGAQLWADRSHVEVITLEGNSTVVLLRAGEAVLLGTPSRYEAQALTAYLDYRGVRRVAALVAYDCGEQISAGLHILQQQYPPGCVAGPDDTYVLKQLSLLFGETPVYSMGYGRLLVLGDIFLWTDLRGIPLYLAPAMEEAEETAFLYSGEYGIINRPDEGEAAGRPLNLDGTVIMLGDAFGSPEPLGALLHGETRLVLSLA